MGSGQMVFTRCSDNLRAALNNILPSPQTYECTWLAYTVLYLLVVDCFLII